MAEYYYSKHYKKWANVGMDVRIKLSPEKINDLKNANTNKKFLVYKNSYAGIRAQRIYMDIENVKLILKTRIFAYEDSGYCKSMALRPIKDIINKNILKNINEDFLFISVYIDSMHKDIFHSGEEDLCKKSRDAALNELTDEQRLFYETY